LSYSSAKISVILPVYNRTRILCRAIKSILVQSFADFELIVVDDGSTEDVKGTINEFCDTRVRYHRCAIRQGAGAARNIGVRLAVADYVAFQDSDDVWLPENLKKHWKVIEENGSSYSVIYSDMIWQPISYAPMAHTSPDVETGRLINPDTRFYQTYLIGIQSCLIRKSAIMECGGFNEDLPCFEDLDLLLRLSKTHHFWHIRERLVEYYETESSISHQIKNEFVVRRFLLRNHKEALRSFRFLYLKEKIICILAASSFLGEYLSRGNYQTLAKFSLRKFGILYNKLWKSMGSIEYVQKTLEGLHAYLSMGDQLQYTETVAIMSPVDKYRLDQTRRVLRLGTCKRVLVFEHTDLTFWQDIQRQVKPAFDVERIPIPIRYRASTHGEAVALVRYLRQHSIDSVVVITSDYHTRRVLLTLRNLGQPGMEFYMAPAAADNRSIPRWWLNPTNRRNYGMELFKLALYWMWYFNPIIKLRQPIPEVNLDTSKS